jgi:hypothetical protein
MGDKDSRTKSEHTENKGAQGELGHTANHVSAGTASSKPCTKQQ